MSRPDERARPRLPADAQPGASAATNGTPGNAPPSKTRRKAEMHALQDLGEALVALDPKRLTELANELGLPERLCDAIREARTITAWGGRKRQLQYVGKLMRDIDAEPIRRRLDLWAQGHDLDSARQRALGRWRERLIAEYPRLDRSRFRALIAKARDERSRGQPPHAYRELFRELKSLDASR
jgi:ribosome-associated protein